MAINTSDTRQYILDQRAKGVPDSKIYDSLQNRSVTSERGFAGELLPTIGSIGGGIAGGALGGPAGAIVGSGIGGGLGETAQQGIEKLTGTRESFSAGQVAATGATSAVLQGVAGKALQIGSRAVKAVQPSILKTLSWASGYADDVVKKAMERTPGAVEAIKGGEKTLSNLVQRSAAKVSKFADDLLKSSQKVVDDLSKKLSFGGPGRPGSRSNVLRQGKKFVENIVNVLRKEHNIGSSMDGKLVFNRPTQPSRIVTGGDQKAIQEGFDLVLGIKKNTSIKHIDSVLERLIVLKSKTPVGSPTGPQTKSIIGDMMSKIQDFVKTTYPEYYQHLTSNLPKRILANEMKELFGGSAHLSPLETSKISGRLLQLYNTGRLPLREGVEQVGKEIGEDITGTVAGTIMKLDDSVSFRALNLGQREMITKAIQSIPRKLIDDFVATGKLTGGLLSHPIVVNTAKTLGITTKAAGQFIANQLMSKEEN